MARLGDVCSFFSGTGFPNAYQGQKTGKYPFYKVGDISKNVLLGNRELISSDNYIDDDTVQAIKGTVLPPKTVVFAKIGETLRLNRRAITNCYCLVDNNAMGILADNTVLDELYFYYFMCSVDLQHYCESTTVPSVRKTRIAEIEIPLPSLEEQRRIAALLDKVSDLIAKRRAQLDKLDLLVKARFVEMFGDPVINPHRYMVQSLQSLIDDGAIIYHLDGNHGGDYPRNEEFVDSGVPYIGANCISKGKIDFRYAKYLTTERAGKLRKGIAKNGDVLFAHNATVGPVAVLETDEPKVILSTSLTAYRCNQNAILPHYLKVYMQSEGFVRQYSEEMKQTTRNQVPITAQKKYLFLIPPMALQAQFNAFAVQTDKSKLTIQQSLDRLETLKKALMQQYFE